MKNKYLSQLKVKEIHLFTGNKSPLIVDGIYEIESNILKDSEYEKLIFVDGENTTAYVNDFEFVYLRKNGNVSVNWQNFMISIFGKEYENDLKMYINAIYGKRAVEENLVERISRLTHVERYYNKEEFYNSLQAENKDIFAYDFYSEQNISKDARDFVLQYKTNDLEI